MKITDFIVMDSQGDVIKADPHGNNVAINCEICTTPILLTALINQRGSDKEHPAKCRGCGQQYFLDVRDHKEMLYVHKIQ